MMSFEDLESWQKAREIVRDIYTMTGEDRLSRDFGLCGQVQRAGVSIMSNIAEGFERHLPSRSNHVRKSAFHFAKVPDAGNE
jgi:four helix bundle protein